MTQFSQVFDIQKIDSKTKRGRCRGCDCKFEMEERFLSVQFNPNTTSPKVMKDKRMKVCAGCTEQLMEMLNEEGLGS